MKASRDGCQTTRIFLKKLTYFLDSGLFIEYLHALAPVPGTVRVNVNRGSCQASANTNKSILFSISRIIISEFLVLEISTLSLLSKYFCMAHNIYLFISSLG